MRAKAGYGLGFTLEHSFINNDKSFFGTSLRGRYLFSSTSGQDYKRSYGIANNTVLNGTDNHQTNYLSSTGYVYQNYKTSIQDLDLELLINTNRLKARKGINLYAFGGIGYVGYKTFIDQLDFSGSQYDYNAVSDFTKNITLSDINALKDNNYETPAEGGTQRKFVLAPSFGGGISFRVVPNFYIGFEHKVTFPKTDLLDGQRWKNDNTLSGKNDVYHYSNMYFNIGLFGGSYVSTTQNPVEQSPVIHLIYPSGEIFEAVDCKASVSASVKNVYNRKSIEVRQDGVLVYDFDFNISSGVVSFSRKLTGNSVFVITASNSGGTVSKTIRINCTPYNNSQELPAPIINMIFPQQDSYTATKCYVEIKAQKEKDAADQHQRDQDEADRQQKAKDAADKAQKEKDAADQRQRDQDEADRQQKAKDDADKAQKEKDAADQRQRDQDEADRQQKAKDDADKQQKANDGADNQPPSKDASDKPQNDGSNDNKDK